VNLFDANEDYGMQVMVVNFSNWICLKKTKDGHPHHPTRLAYDEMEFALFDMDKYIEGGANGSNKKRKI
jgi:hypothetical protein